MKQYFKPIFRLAGNVQNPGEQVSCATKNGDLELIAAILGVSVEQLGDPDAFAQMENCALAYPDVYCKFTATAFGKESLFQS